MIGSDSQEFQRRLRDAGPETLLELLRAHLVQLDPPALRLLFRNPHLNAEMIEMILAERRLLTFQEVRRELVKHRQTPEVRALRFVSGLFWRDLLDISGDTQVRPRVRRAAERHLLDRLAGLGIADHERVVSHRVNHRRDLGLAGRLIRQVELVGCLGRVERVF